MSGQLCISCRTPVGNRRSYTWTSRESQHTDVAQFVIEDLLVRQEEPTEVICRPCWQRAERRYLRHQREVDHDVADEEVNAEPHASPTVLPNLNRRRSQFQPMAADMTDFNDFPTLTEEDLILFSLGVYQLKQAKSYYGEHLQSDGVFIIELGGGIPLEIVRELEGEDLWIIRGRIQSRHIQAKKYHVYIALDRAANGRRALAHYYCTCNIGKRTIGCCSHTMTIVWYMGYARHDPYLTPPAIGLHDVYVRLGQI